MGLGNYVSEVEEDQDDCSELEEDEEDQDDCSDDCFETDISVTGLGHCTINFDCRKVITTCCLLKCVPSTLSLSTVAFFAYLPNGIRSP